MPKAPLMDPTPTPTGTTTRMLTLTLTRRARRQHDELGVLPRRKRTWGRGVAFGDQDPCGGIAGRLRRTVREVSSSSRGKKGGAVGHSDCSLRAGNRPAPVSMADMQLGISWVDRVPRFLPCLRSSMSRRESSEVFVTKPG